MRFSISAYFALNLNRQLADQGNPCYGFLFLPMKKLFLFLALLATPALSQTTTTAPTPVVSSDSTQQAKPAKSKKKAHPAQHVEQAKPAKPAPVAEPKRKSGGFFGFFRWLFGGGSSEKAVPAPQPTPAVQPATVRKSAPSVKSTATPKPSPAPKASATPKPTPASKPMATPKPAPSPKASKKIPAATPVPTPAEISRTALPPATASTTGDPRYLQLKEQALKTSQVANLLKKMNSQPEGGDAYKAAATEYTTALFSKMRQLDPSYEEQLNRKEGAYKRRIEAGKSIVE